MTTVADVLEVATKRCKRCGDPKPLDAFPRHPQSADGYMHICRACRSGPRHRELSEDELERARVLYFGQHMALSDVAGALNRSRHIVERAFRAAGYTPRTRSEAARLGGERLNAEGFKEIGQSERYAEVDAAIRRARLEAGMIDGRRRSLVGSVWRQSSLVG